MNFKHGETKTVLYKKWDSMRQRCKNPNNPSYPHYGARGITVCKEWDNFLSFKQWSISNGYQPNLSIDRIDVNGNYEPSNCRWADVITQANNKTTSRYIEYNGRKQTVAQWAKELNMSMWTLRRRLYYNNWTVEKAFTQPTTKYNLKEKNYDT